MLPSCAAVIGGIALRLSRTATYDRHRRNKQTRLEYHGILPLYLISHFTYHTHQRCVVASNAISPSPNRICKMADHRSCVNDINLHAKTIPLPNTHSGNQVFLQFGRSPPPLEDAAALPPRFISLREFVRGFWWCVSGQTRLSSISVYWSARSSAFPSLTAARLSLDSSKPLLICRAQHKPRFPMIVSSHGR